MTAEMAPEMNETLEAYLGAVRGDFSVDAVDKFGFHRYIQFDDAGKLVTSNVTAHAALQVPSPFPLPLESWTGTKGWRVQRRAKEHLLLIGAQYDERDRQEGRLEGEGILDKVTYSLKEVVEGCSFGPSPALPPRNSSAYLDIQDTRAFSTCSVDPEFP